VITARASRRIARFAFELARREHRRKIVAIHKANIMKLSDGLFLACARQVAKHHPRVRYEELIVDNACMQLVLRPQEFDVLLLENLYGDIVSDLCAGLVGGLGLVPGANLGVRCAIFEAVHGTAPDITGKNLANPLAVILSSVMLLRHVGQRRAAKRSTSSWWAAGSTAPASRATRRCAGSGWRSSSAATSPRAPRAGPPS